MSRPLLRLVGDDTADRPHGSGVDLLDAWRGYLAATGASPATIATRIRTLSSLMSSAGVDDPARLTRDHVVVWLGRPIKAWSRLTYWSGVNAFSQWAREFGHSDVDLVQGIPRPGTPAPVARPIDDATIGRLLGLALPPRPHAYVRLALFQALRVHEIAKIRGEDLDLSAGWLTVTGKGGGTKLIPVHPVVGRLAETMPEAGYWFPSARRAGQPVNPSAVTATITAALRSVGCRATPHQLRDTAATRFQREVKDIRLTQTMLRHSNVTSTMKYTAPADDAMQAAVTSLGWADRAGDMAEARQLAELPPGIDQLSAEQLRGLLAELIRRAGPEGEA